MNLFQMGYGISSRGLGAGNVYSLAGVTRVDRWMGMAKTLGVGYAAKAHKGVYLQIDWRSFNRWVGTQLKAGEMGAKKTVLEIGQDLHKRIKSKNPIRTGLSRAAWELRTVPGLLQKEKPYVVIANQVYYVVSLEFGSSRQAPNGMVRVSMKEMMGMPAREMQKQLHIERQKMANASVGAAIKSRTVNLQMGGE